MLKGLVYRLKTRVQAPAPSTFRYSRPCTTWAWTPRGPCLWSSPTVGRWRSGPGTPTATATANRCLEGTGEPPGIHGENGWGFQGFPEIVWHLEDFWGLGFSGDINGSYGESVRIEWDISWEIVGDNNGKEWDLPFGSATLRHGILPMNIICNGDFGSLKGFRSVKKSDFLVSWIVRFIIQLKAPCSIAMFTNQRVQLIHMFHHCVPDFAKKCRILQNKSKRLNIDGV